jgi:hypothetical protein
MEEREEGIMFYCDECAEEKVYPFTIHRSYGMCEICKKTKPCNDFPSKNLPKLKERLNETKRRRG